MPPSGGRHARKDSTAAARTGEFNPPPSGSGVHVPPPEQSALVTQIEWPGGEQLLVQKVVALAPPSGPCTKVPQQTSPALQEADEHSNCVALLHALRSRHVPDWPIKQHVCPRVHSGRPNGLHGLGASLALCPPLPLAKALSPRPPPSLEVPLPLFDDEPHATKSTVLKDTPIKTLRAFTRNNLR